MKQSELILNQLKEHHFDALCLLSTLVSALDLEKKQNSCLTIDPLEVGLTSESIDLMINAIELNQSPSRNQTHNLEIMTDLFKGLLSRDVEFKSVNTLDDLQSKHFNPQQPSNFVVNWSIDSEADSAQEAAEEAFIAMRAPDSIATVFSVKDSRGRIIEIDMGN
ncbi:hypothetical protein A1QO_04195 [Vibrio genomosp. F10 str. ZF-129]|uniref:Uncharacterized protein n=1 Tax=Vibrio genomosp. F10 str. ZF-129 TaxID=1187848 RepID=A0A1E5BIT3_9VIBR|nr:hypothetical protein [Vibrio genomosp. F10]OEE37313.1 hypothetical protein A1QO_04195 [Vibrio genomosp. F10 str. ZF-129]